jgi:phosphoglycerol transferase MdoB-like AlkP superfamily enzyme
LQTAVEWATFLLLSWYLPRFFLFFSALFASLLFLSRLIDFALVRLMNLSFWEAFRFVVRESGSNFLEILKASDISLFSWLKGALIALSIVGFLSYLFLRKRKESESFYLKRFLAFYALNFVTLISIDFAASRLFPVASHVLYRQTLPWKNSFFAPHLPFLSFPHPFLIYPEGKAILSEEYRSLSLNKKPNIFLFIIESLREDYIDAQKAPHLFSFKQSHFSFPISLSNANATHISWFSLFYSRYPFFWNAKQARTWLSGSPALQLFKRLGYTTHVYTSSRLSYYQMDQTIFGKGCPYPVENCQLIDYWHPFFHEESEEAYVSDQRAVQKLCKDMERFQKEKGHLFIIFLDSTHFGYSFPKEQPLRFSPIVDQINYLALACGLGDLNRVKNRYCNAVFYIDQLFGSFLKRQKATFHGDRDVIVVTSDHGEEFNECGYLFHASSLTYPQTRIPLYYRLGRLSPKRTKPYPLTSHMDIFPTLLHYVTGQEIGHPLFQGQSIFSKKHVPYVFTARYNGGKAPYEFFIHNLHSKLFLQFNHPYVIQKSDRFFLLSYTDPYDLILSEDRDQILREFQPAIDSLFYAP